MKTIIAACTILLYASISTAQISAVTSSGEEVILNTDGTWKYAKAAPAGEKKEIPANPTPFTQGKDATFQVKSTVVNANVFLNPKKWSFKKGKADDAAEFTFELKKKDASAMMITEKIEMPMETLRGVAFDNAKGAAPDVQIVHEEYRTVNGKKILCMQMDGTISGIKFTYFGYYYVGAGCTLQLLCYTSQNLFAEYKAEMEELLNGLVIGG